MATLSFDVLWRDHGASRGLQNLGKDADKAHGSFSKFSSTASKGLAGAGMAAAKFGAAGAAALAGVGVAALAYGVKTASANEQARISFTTMLGSASKADAFLRDLQKFAATTPFEFPELQKAASSLISVGVNAGDVLPIMKTLGDVTSGMGTGAEGVDRATRALQQMQAAGRITAEDLNQLRDAGIPLSAIFDAIGDKTGKSAKQIAEMSRTGKLGRTELNALMDALESGRGFEKFNGLMAAQSQSLEGMWSTLKDTFGQGMAQIVEPFLPVIKTMIGGVSTQFTKMTDYVVANQADIISGFFDMGESVLGFAQSTSGSITQAIRWFGNLEVQIADNLDQIAAFHEVLAGSSFFPPQMREGFRNVANGLREQSGKFRESGTRARDFADTMDGKLSPAMEKARAAAKRLRDQAVIRAGERQAATDLSRALDRVGQSGKLTEKELRTFNTTSGTGTKRQGELRKSLQDARTALINNYNAAVTSGKRHGELNEILKTGRKRLFDELVQMGFSIPRARALANQYTNVKNEVKKIPKSHDTKLTNNAGKNENPRRAIKGYEDAIRDIPRTWMTKLQYDTSVDGINSRLVQRAGRFAVQMSQGSRADLARSPSTLAMLHGHSHGSLPNGFGGPDATTAGSLAYQRAGQSGVSRALRDGARNSASGPYGSVTGGGAGRAAGIREGMRWATSGGTYPGHHPSMNKAWISWRPDPQATGSPAICGPTVQGSVCGI